MVPLQRQQERDRYPQVCDVERVSSIQKIEHIFYNSDYAQMTRLFFVSCVGCIPMRYIVCPRKEHLSELPTRYPQNPQALPIPAVLQQKDPDHKQLPLLL